MLHSNIWVLGIKTHVFEIICWGNLFTCLNVLSAKNGPKGRSCAKTCTQKQEFHYFSGSHENFIFPKKFSHISQTFSCFVDFFLGLSISFVNMKNVFDVWEMFDHTNVWAPMRLRTDTQTGCERIGWYYKGWGLTNVLIIGLPSPGPGWPKRCCPRVGLGIFIFYAMEIGGGKATIDGGTRRQWDPPTGGGNFPMGHHFAPAKILYAPIRSSYVN